MRHASPRLPAQPRPHGQGIPAAGKRRQDAAAAEEGARGEGARGELPDSGAKRQRTGGGSDAQMGLQVSLQIDVSREGAALGALSLQFKPLQVCHCCAVLQTLELLLSLQLKPLQARRCCAVLQTLVLLLSLQLKSL